MSTGISMPVPVCLIENDENNQLTINEEALQILTNISKPLVVVAIVGKYRTGKSYLMNNLAGCKKGFSLGSTIQSQTKGIWMWCVPHPLKQDHVLVLLDTEGLGDVEKGDSDNDSWIFCLSVLLSSNLVFNSVGTIDQQSVEQLQYVSELTKRIRLQASKEKEDERFEFKRVFPSFTWCVRDFTLELKYEGKDITEDEYLMNSLKRKSDLKRKKRGDENPKSKDPNHKKKIDDYNLPRICILQYFHSHKCFVFQMPTGGKKLKDLEDLADHELDKSFVIQAKSFCDYIFMKGSVKTLPGGLVVNGRMLGHLLSSYMSAIQSGSVPCMENAVRTLAESENTKAVTDAVTRYEAEMKKHVSKFPTETEVDFFHLHLECEKIALEVFLARSFKDEEQKHQHILKDRIKSVMEQFSQMNEESSIQFCKNLLDELSQTLETNLSENYYSKPGGHKLFLEEKIKIMEIYRTKPGKGIKAQEEEQEFFNKMRNTETTIRVADNSLSEKEKEIAAKEAEAETAMREREISEENNRKMRVHLEEERKRHEQHVEMLMVKMEEDRKMLMGENKLMLERKLKEVEALKAAEFQEFARQQNALIAELRNRPPPPSRGVCVIL